MRPGELGGGRRRGLEFIAGLPDSEKKEWMRKVFDLYMDAKKAKEIEGAVKCQIVRSRPEGGSVTAALKTDTSLLRTKREGGDGSASVRDLHSFRVS